MLNSDYVVSQFAVQPCADADRKEKCVVPYIASEYDISQSATIILISSWEGQQS